MEIRSSRPGAVSAMLVALLAAVVGVALWTLRPSAARPADAPADHFSEGRARDVVQRLVDLGHRINGTPAHARAADLLAAELRRIPGLEVEVQDVSGTEIYRSSVLGLFGAGTPALAEAYARAAPLPIGSVVGQDPTIDAASGGRPSDQDEGAELTLTVRGRAPLPVLLRAIARARARRGREGAARRLAAVDHDDAHRGPGEAPRALSDAAGQNGRRDLGLAACATSSSEGPASTSRRSASAP